MLYPIKLYLKHPVTLTLLCASLVMNVAIWVWLLWQLSPTGEPIFLHYNILFGVDAVGDWFQIFSLPLLGLALFVINAVLGWLCFHKDKYLAHFFNSTALLCQLLLLVAAGLLVVLNV